MYETSDLRIIFVKYLDFPFLKILVHALTEVGFGGGGGGSWTKYQREGSKYQIGVPFDCFLERNLIKPCRPTTR